MKKRIAAGVLSLALCVPVFGGCYNTDQNEIKNADGTSAQVSVVNEISSNKLTNAEVLQTESPQLERWQYIHSCFEANEYDVWLNNVLNNDLLSLEQAYTQYLALWQDEMAFTIQMAKRLFENEDDYLSWKASLEAWMHATEDTYRQETQHLRASLSQCEILERYCKLLRQKVIDTKYFCYSLESELIWFDDVEKYASLRWKYEPQTYYIEKDFAKG